MSRWPAVAYSCRPTGYCRLLTSPGSGGPQAFTGADDSRSRQDSLQKDCRMKTFQKIVLLLAAVTLFAGTGHAGIEGNEEADKLARQALKC